MSALGSQPKFRNQPERSMPSLVGQVPLDASGSGAAFRQFAPPSTDSKKPSFPTTTMCFSVLPKYGPHPARTGLPRFDHVAPLSFEKITWSLVIQYPMPFQTRTADGVGVRSDTCVHVAPASRLRTMPVPFDVTSVRSSKIPAAARYPLPTSFQDFPPLPE